MDSDPAINLRRIGSVRNSAGQLGHGVRQEVSRIEIDGDWGEALEGIDGFSHLLVLYWMHLLGDEQRNVKRIHPRDCMDLPLLGVFATHTQYRPNPIGLTLVKLLGRQGNTLHVLGLDALDGSPVLDLKPYTPPLEPAEDVCLPEWVSEFK